MAGVLNRCVYVASVLVCKAVHDQLGPREDAKFGECRAQVLDIAAKIRQRVRVVANAARAHVAGQLAGVQLVVDLEREVAAAGARVSAATIDRALTAAGDREAHLGNPVMVVERGHREERRRAGSFSRSHEVANHPLRRAPATGALSNGVNGATDAERWNIS